MTIESAIKARLDVGTALKALTHGRNYAVIAPAGAELPFTTFQVISETPVHAMGSDAGYREARVQVSSFDRNHDRVALVDEAARTALSRFRGTAGGTVVQDVLAETAGDAFLAEVEEGIFQRSRDFRVFYE